MVKFSAVAKDFKAILPVFKKENIALADGPGDGEPVVAADEIVFNGRDEESYEWFDIKQVYSERDLHPDDPMKFAFCKTGRRPYNLAVMCCLIIFKHHFRDDIRVQSDDQTIEEWAPAIDLVREHLKYAEDWAFRGSQLVDKKSEA